MNEEIEKSPDLTNRISGILDWVEQTAKTTEGFVIEQTPLYIQELLAWNFWESIIYFGIGVFFLTICGFLIKHATKVDWSYGGNDGEQALTSIGSGLFFAIGSGFAFANLDWLKILIAPKVWLVEYAAELVKSL